MNSILKLSTLFVSYALYQNITSLLSNTITVLPAPAATVTLLDTCAANPKLRLDSAAANISGFRWQKPNGSLVNSRTVTIDTPGTYRGTVFYANGCSRTVNYTTTSLNGGLVVGTGAPSQMSGKEKLSTYLNAGMLPASGVQNQRLIVAGTFEIDTNYTFGAGSRFTCLPGASIKVMPGKTLTLSGSSSSRIILSTCRDTLWQGIEVAAAVMGMFGQVQTAGGSLSMNFTNLSDALYGVQLRSGSSYGITNTNFINNFIGLAGAGSVQLSFFGININATAAFTGNVFASTGNVLKRPFANMPSLGSGISLPAPQAATRGYAGVYLSNLGTFTAGASGSARDSFAWLHNGIITYNMNLSVTNSIFDSMKLHNYSTGSAPLGYGVYASGITLGTAGEPQYPISSLSVTGLGNAANSRVVFNGCVYGVLANTVNTEVKQCRFRAISNTAIRAQNNSYGNTKINENRIEARSYGVYCLLNDPYFDQSITNNQITVGGSLGFGIYVSESGLPPLDTTSGTINFIGRNNVVVQQNAICGIFANSMQGARIASDTVYLLNHLMAQAGITLTGCTKLLVSDNIIKGRSPLTSNQSIYPVGILSAGSTDGIIKCNTTDSTYQGMVFNGNNTGTRIALNQMRRHYIGMRVTPGGSISPQWQISPNISIPYYNTFTPGTFASWAAVHEDTNNYVYQKIFVPFTSTQGGADGYWPAVGKISPADWFDQGFEIPLNCGSNLREMENPDSLDAWESRIAAGQAAFSIYTPELKWQHERYLFEKIKDNESLQAADEEAAVFFAAQAASSKGALEQVETMLEESEQTVADSIPLLLRLQQSKLLEIAALDSLYAPAENDTTETLWMLPAAADSVKETLKEITYALESVQRQVKAKSSQNAANAADNNKKIVTDGFVAENETRYNAVFTATKARGIAELNTGAQDTIRQLACQCPLKGGKAVYKARSLYALVKDTVYDDLAMCNEVGMIHYKTDETSAEIKDTLEKALNIDAVLYPNPARDKVYIVFNQFLDEPLNVSIRDAQGREVAFRFAVRSGKVMELETKDVSNGYYHVVIHIASTDKKIIKRLIIAK